MAQKLMQFRGLCDKNIVSDKQIEIQEDGNISFKDFLTLKTLKHQINDFREYNNRSNLSPRDKYPELDYTQRELTLIPPIL